MIWTLAIFAGGTTGLIAILVMLMLVVLLMSPLGGAGMMRACAPSDTTGGPGAVQAKANASSIPRNYLALYIAAGRAWNIPWNVLAGIGYIETHHGTLQAQGVHSGENFAGAGGPMQFLQSTFDRVKVDGNGDGVKSRYDSADAIYSAAKLLKVHIIGIGASTQELKRRTLTAAEIRRSLYSYNHSWSYVDDVLAQANRYDKDHTVASANYAGTGCSGIMALGSGPFGQRIATAAALLATREGGKPQPPRPTALDKSFKPIPYSWGGGTFQGPSRGICCSPGGYDGRLSTGFDCSGLARYAVYQASNEKVELPRTTTAMLGSNKAVGISRDQLAAGDLVFFSGGAHVAVFYGNFNGKRWMVEALRTGTYVQFSEFDTRSGFYKALRVTPPPGMNTPPSQIRAMAPARADVGEGAM
jgi:hypothetical protein